MGCCGRRCPCCHCRRHSRRRRSHRGRRHSAERLHLSTCPPLTQLPVVFNLLHGRQRKDDTGKQGGSRNATSDGVARDEREKREQRGQVQAPSLANRNKIFISHPSPSWCAAGVSAGVGRSGPRVGLHPSRPQRNGARPKLTHGADALDLGGGVHTPPWCLPPGRGWGPGLVHPSTAALRQCHASWTMSGGMGLDRVAKETHERGGGGGVGASPIGGMAKWQKEPGRLGMSALSLAPSRHHTPPVRSRNDHRFSREVCGGGGSRLWCGVVGGVPPAPCACLYRPPPLPLETIRWVHTSPHKISCGQRHRRC